MAEHKASVLVQDPCEHILTIEDDGHWYCSCHQWGSRNLGSVHEEYCQRNGITDVIIKEWHANAIVIQI